jgi:hypothetical protein
MPEEKKNPDQLVADSMSKLFGGLGSTVANPLGGVRQSNGPIASSDKWCGETAANQRQGSRWD